MVDSTTFLGEWYDNDNSFIEVVDGTSGQLRVTMMKDGVNNRYFSIRQLPDGWALGDYLLQMGSRNHMVWRTPQGTLRVWTRSQELANLIAGMDREIASLRERVQTKEQECRASTRLIARKDQEVASLREDAQALTSAAPHMTRILEFTQQISNMHPGIVDDIPVGALRFTQHDMNKSMALSAGAHQDESVYKLLDDLLRGVFTLRETDGCCRLDASDFGHLDVFPDDCPDGSPGLYCACNRRLLALLCFQALWRDTTVFVPCRIHDKNSSARSPEGKLKLREWYSQRYCFNHCHNDGPIDGCDGFGLSIFPRYGVSKHLGVKIF